MVTRTPRLLLMFSAVLLATGGVLHAAVFPRIAGLISSSNLAPFVANSCKGLWLDDSASMFLLSALFGLIAARPYVATRPVVLLLALIPGATAVFIYIFLGGFFAGHILLATAAASICAGLQFPAARVGGRVTRSPGE